MASGVVWAPGARIDLARIDDYYAGRDLDFANRTARNAVAAAQFLLANPFAGPKVEGTAYRKWHVAESPCLLIYRPERSTIHIVRVHRVREDWPSLA